MDFELKLEEPNVSRAWISAATMGAAYFVGMYGAAVKTVLTPGAHRWLDANGALLCD